MLRKINKILRKYKKNKNNLPKEGLFSNIYRY